MKNCLSKDIREKLGGLLTWLKPGSGEGSAYNDDLTITPDLSNMSEDDLTAHVNAQAALINDLKKQLNKAKDKHSARGSGEPSVIEDLSNRLQEAEIKLSASALQNQHVTAQNIVKTHMVAASSMALVPVPVLDFATLTGTHINLLRKLSSHFNVDFDEQKGKALLTSLLSGSVPLLTVMGLSSFSKLIPGIGTVGGGISMALLSSAIVYATGQVFISHFERGGTLEDFEAKQWKHFFMQSLEKQKASGQWQTDNSQNNDPSPTETNAGAL